MIQVRNGNPSSGALASKIALVDEACSGSDARDILNGLLDAGVNFQKLQCLRSQVHTHCPQRKALDRMQELEQARSTIEDMLVQARGRNLHVRVRSTVELVIEEGLTAPEN